MAVVAWARDWVERSGARRRLPDTAGHELRRQRPSKDIALASAGAELRLANGVTLGANFDGEFADGSSTYAGTGTVRVAW